MEKSLQSVNSVPAILGEVSASALGLNHRLEGCLSQLRGVDETAADKSDIVPGSTGLITELQYIKEGLQVASQKMGELERLLGVTSSSAPLPIGKVRGRGMA